MIVRAAPREHYPWLIERIGIAVTPAFRAIEAVDPKGQIRGMVGYDGWTANSVQLHIALDTPIAFRSLLRWLFVYAFEEAGRGLAIVTVIETNQRSLQLTKSVGFRETHRFRDGWARGVDLVVLEMRREECRWLSRERKAA